MGGVSGEDAESSEKKTGQSEKGNSSRASKNGASSSSSLRSVEVGRSMGDGERGIEANG